MGGKAEERMIILTLDKLPGIHYNKKEELMRIIAGVVIP